VLAMLGGEGEVQVLPVNNALPGDGIFIGEAASSSDILKWTDKTGAGIVAAGASDFFTALLERQYKERKVDVSSPSFPHLYVSGTTFEKSVAFIRELDQQRHCVAWLPFDDEQAWLAKVSKIIAAQNRLAIAFDNSKLSNDISALSLRKMMAVAIKRVIDEGDIKELFIEGGSTAAGIIRELGISSLLPVEEWQRGVVRMKAGDLFITVKPGSYELPHQIKTIYQP
jgi:D-threonate/D-erythronate kinase